MADLRQGQIVWAEVVDARGVNPKTRPVVIITPSSEVPEGESLIGVAVTTTIPSPVPPYYVELPYNPNKFKVRTRLTSRCAAVCSWVVGIHEEDIQEYAGLVTGPQLEAILRQLSDRADQAAEDE